MIHSLSGTLREKGDGFAVVEAGGVGFKVFMAGRSLAGLPRAGATVSLSTHFHVRENALELYGFRNGEELWLFEQLISVSGVGPKSALAVLDVADLRQIAATIQEGRPDLLTKASGIGRKTAERIVVELRGRVGTAGAGTAVVAMEQDADLLESLVSLGYRRDDARAALLGIDPKTTELRDRLKAALKALGRT